MSCSRHLVPVRSIGGGLLRRRYEGRHRSVPKRFFRFCERLRLPGRIVYVRAHFFCEEELRGIFSQNGFCVKGLAVHLGLDIRTLERRFGRLCRTTPKTWMTRERMSLAPPLLADGHSNKEVAASLNYTCESNFCRDFKRYFGCARTDVRAPSGGRFLCSRVARRAESSRLLEHPNPLRLFLSPRLFGPSPLAGIEETARPIARLPLWPYGRIRTECRAQGANYDRKWRI